MLAEVCICIPSIPKKGHFGPTIKTRENGKLFEAIVLYREIKRKKNKECFFSFLDFLVRRALCAVKHQGGASHRFLCWKFASFIVIWSSDTFLSCKVIKMMWSTLGLLIIFTVVSIALIWQLWPVVLRPTPSPPPTPFKKLFFQTVPCTTDIHPDISEQINENIRNNAGWQHVLFDDEKMEDYIATRWGDSDIARAYRRISPVYGVAKADIFRYLIILDRGGFYLDAKSRIGSIDKLAEKATNAEKYPVVFWDDRATWQEYVNWFLLDIQGSIVLKKTVEKIVTAIENLEKDSGGRFTVLETTGPKIYTAAIKEMEKAGHECTYLTSKDVDAIGIAYSGVVDHRAKIKPGAVHYFHQSAPLLIQDSV